LGLSNRNLSDVCGGGTGSGPYGWEFSLNTRNLPEGSQTVTAVGEFPSGTASDTLSLNVDNVRGAGISGYNQGCNGYGGGYGGGLRRGRNGLGGGAQIDAGGDDYGGDAGSYGGGRYDDDVCGGGSGYYDHCGGGYGGGYGGAYGGGYGGGIGGGYGGGCYG